MSRNFNKFVDEYQNLHIHGEVLGKGGQGIVFRTKDPDVAIKLVLDEKGNRLSDKGSIETYSRRFKRIRLLPLPDGLNISVPVALLQDDAGYVMRLLSEMVPISHLWAEGKALNAISPDDIPSWLSAIPETEAKKIVHYYRTGGLRRRLIVLFKCASLLARLHGHGLVYGDISHNNIFISEGTEEALVWLIDADNLRFEVEVEAGGRAFYTPKYGAPEILQRKDGGRPASDCHAFAVVAFWLLSMIHPFIGRKVDGTDDCDWAESDGDGEDIEDKAYAGFLPWVDDQNDDANSSDGGLPRSLLLTEKLRALFEATFGPGRTSPWMRPAIFHWPEAFAQAADTVLTCPGCGMGYYGDYADPETGGHHCPYCSARRPEMLTLESYRWNGPGIPLGALAWRYTREITGECELTIPRRVLDDFTMVDADTAEITIAPAAGSVRIRKLDHSACEVMVAVESAGREGFQKLFSQLEIARSAPETRFWLFIQLNSPRLVLCSISGGGK
ncbi:serine/threonine protein kinase [Geomonas paludis]|uniref:Serine/threonine protein kinase n=1 Tax=Geomonas paludis TaxID=2740185 RepID=A0ABY4LIC4_9BACT|nr:serine/threonine protein kinase [Geomonas paludis]UPU37504.1 serine/threonine protein kinase [Geomonas paludis]